MLTTHAVGIDLGTTYSCIAYLNEHGEPVTLANQEGELATPSVVLFDDNETIVGTEALRNAILRPSNVVQNSKRWIGDPRKSWTIDGRRYTPVDVASFVLKKLISAAQQQIGPIAEAVITVPAQFSDAQRHATLEAGHRAGLERVDIINEPVAAALCYVLGTDGLWFTELADEQRIMVYDLGGGTFDLSLVRYHKDEVSVLASSGDLELGGLDWTRLLQDAIAEQFVREFKCDPRSDPESLQALSLEAEQAKRSLSVRSRTPLTCQHGGHRKTFQVEQSQFQQLTKPLVERTADITTRMLKDNRMGWAHVDVVLTTGGSSRMPMVRDRLQKLSGRTLNTALSPDQSIAHGATFYAGMLLTNKKFSRSILTEQATSRLQKIKQQSVNARSLGVLVRDASTNRRKPHYLIPENTPLPVSTTQHYGTAIPNQRRVHLQIVESGTSSEQPLAKLGDCVIDGLPHNLPQGAQVEVTISYDEQARVHVSARDLTSGREASTEIIRQENLVAQLEHFDEDDVTQPAAADPATPSVPADRNPPAIAKPAAGRRTPAVDPSASQLEDAFAPIPLCNDCGEPLDHRGRCTACGMKPSVTAPPPSLPSPTADSSEGRRFQRKSGKSGAKIRRPQEAGSAQAAQRPTGTRKIRGRKSRPQSPPPLPSRPDDDHRVKDGEEDFWELVE